MVIEAPSQVGRVSTRARHKREASLWQCPLLGLLARLATVVLPLKTGRTLHACTSFLQLSSRRAGVASAGRKKCVRLECVSECLV